jgi:hypothetical protein
MAYGIALFMASSCHESSLWKDVLLRLDLPFSRSLTSTFLNISANQSSCSTGYSSSSTEPLIPSLLFQRQPHRSTPRSYRHSSLTTLGSSIQLFFIALASTYSICLRIDAHVCGWNRVRSNHIVGSSDIISWPVCKLLHSWRLPTQVKRTEKERKRQESMNLIALGSAIGEGYVLFHFSSFLFSSPYN